MSLSFQQESPYLHEELQETIAASLGQANHLKEITLKMEEYTRITKQLAACGNDLSEMLNRSLPQVANPSSSSVKHLSTILSEMSTSADILSETLQHSFVRPMDLFLNSREMTEIELLYSQYHERRAHYEHLLQAYLNSDFIKASHLAGARKEKGASVSIERKALDVVESCKKLETCRFDVISRSSAQVDRRVLEVTEVCTCAAMGLINFAHTLSTSIPSSTSAALNEISLELDSHKRGYVDKQVSQGRIRRDLESVLEAMIERVLYQMPAESTSTSAPASSPSASHTLYPDYDDHIFLSDTTSIRPSSNSAPAQSISAPKRSVFSFSKLAAGKAPPSASTGMGGMGGMGAASDFLSLQHAETRLKVLELPPEIHSLYSPLSQYTFFSERVRKQGYILYLKSKLPDKKHVHALPWRRDWAVLDDTKLYLVREGFDMELLVNLEVCSVRDMIGVYSYCLEIANANRSSITILCEGESEYKAWKNCLRAGIEDRLGAALRPSVSASKLHESTYDISNLLSLSPLCMDCKQGYTDTPHSWVSLNNATKVCIECSGVHRGLGSHISKVRSLMLDELHVEEYAYLERMMLEGVNERVWEGGKEVIEGVGGDREGYIRRKYMSKAFMRRNLAPEKHTESGEIESGLRNPYDRNHTEIEPEIIDSTMEAAIAQNDCMTAFMCLHQGGCSSPTARTRALILACQHSAAECVVMLVLNSQGIDFDIKAVLANAKGGIEGYLRTKLGV